MCVCVYECVHVVGLKEVSLCASVWFVFHHQTALHNLSLPHPPSPSLSLSPSLSFTHTRFCLRGQPTTRPASSHMRHQRLQICKSLRRKTLRLPSVCALPSIRMLRRFFARSSMFVILQATSPAPPPPPPLCCMHYICTVFSMGHTPHLVPVLTCSFQTLFYCAVSLCAACL